MTKRIKRRPHFPAFDFSKTNKFEELIKDCNVTKVFRLRFDQFVNCFLLFSVKISNQPMHLSIVTIQSNAKVFENLLSFNGEKFGIYNW